MDLIKAFQKHRTQWIFLAILLVLFLLSLQGMGPRDWLITVLRGLSVGSVTFLVAAGFSLIFGLLNVLNLAHGTLFMVGAYVGWTVLVRPDTFIDLLTPLGILAVGLVLMPLWNRLISSLDLSSRFRRLLPWAALLLGVLMLFLVLPHFPISFWSLDNYQQSPVAYAFMADQGNVTLPEPAQFTSISPLVGILGLLSGSLILTLGWVGVTHTSRHTSGIATRKSTRRIPVIPIILAVVILAAALLVWAFNNPLTSFLAGLTTTWRFLIAMLAAILTGFALGGFIESTLIRPLYARPMYQLMLTLGLSAIGIEIVRVIWGRTEFTMPNPSIFNGSGQGCPAKSLSDFLAHQCSTISFMGGRLRTYNEIFIPIIGLIVLVAVWLLLQRTRIGMIIRAGVQDREMVEALGINVLRVFTLVFGLGVGLATLGGVLAGPSSGLSNGMGESYFLNALIALAIGGLTSYPGAAAGSILVGLLQQFMIKYGQIGIAIPFTDTLFKPTPPLVPASTVLLMVIILLITPQGLFGRKE